MKNEAKKVQGKLYQSLNDFDNIVNHYLEGYDDTTYIHCKHYILDEVKKIRDFIIYIEDCDIIEVKKRYPLDYTTDEELLSVYKELSDFCSLEAPALGKKRQDFFEATGHWIRLTPPAEVIEEIGCEYSEINTPLINLSFNEFLSDALTALDDEFELGGQLDAHLIDAMYLNSIDSGFYYDTQDLPPLLKEWGISNEDDIKTIVNGIDAIS